MAQVSDKRRIDRRSKEKVMKNNNISSEHNSFVTIDDD